MKRRRMQPAGSDITGHVWGRFAPASAGPVPETAAARVAGRQSWDTYEEKWQCPTRRAGNPRVSIGSTQRF